MATDRYVLGRGMFGGVKGSYGRYSVGPRVTNLSTQFNDSASFEEAQNRRFKRKRESGYTGAGYWYSAYPNMVGAMASGSDMTARREKPKPKKSRRTATAADGMGMGGTTFNGAAGVS